MVIMNYERAQVRTLVELIGDDHELILFVTGPRQSGKTTLVNQALKRIERPHRYIAVDLPDSMSFPVVPDPTVSPVSVDSGISAQVGVRRDARWLVWQWEQARRDAMQSPNGFVLVMDEIQRIPDWSLTVKGLWDRDRLDVVPLQVVLLGSAPLQMQKGQGESLLGRFLTVHIPHWSFSEMSTAFGFELDTYLFFGGFPGAAGFVQDEMKWRSYVRESIIMPNIERDILALTRVDKPALLRKLLDLGSVYSGQELSLNKMLGQLEGAGNTTTLSRYLDLLGNAGLIAGLPKYTRAAHRARASTPKFNVLNTALMSAQSDYHFAEARADRSRWGRLVESAVGAHFLNDGKPDFSLHYWREENHEVDFVLTYGRRAVAFEVKSGSGRPRTPGLTKFRERFSPYAEHVIGSGGIPLSEFLLTPVKEWFKRQ